MNSAKRNTRWLLIVTLLLLLLPTAGRALWFYRGNYQPPEIASIDEFQISLPATTPNLFNDQPRPAAFRSRVVIDLAHGNNLHIDDLTPLRDRLTARGAKVINAENSTDLIDALRGATALVVMAPTETFSPSELQAVQAFVQDGGRLLIAADPTRPASTPDKTGINDLYDIFFPLSAVPAVNSLANAFGILYFDDYLYNLEENAGNYRNVRFNTLEEHPLLEGVENLVFFASHSLQSNGTSLITGDENTLSPRRMGETDLSAAVITSENRVLALGDFTFLTPSYHTIADNDRFLSNIADWLGEDSRAWDLWDFPYLYTQPIDLIQISADPLAPRLIADFGALQTEFASADLTLTLSESPAEGHDSLIVGTYQDSKQVADLLKAAGVTITLPQENTATPEADSTPSEVNDGATSSITIAGMGTVGMEGIALYVLDRRSEATSLLVLAEDGEALVDALVRLLQGEVNSCLKAEGLMLCSNGKGSRGLGLGDSDKGKSQARDGEVNILIIANDDGARGKRTSANEFEAALKSEYAVTVWSLDRDGVPNEEDLSGYDVYIVSTGDYESEATDNDILNLLDETAGLLLFGAQPFYTFDSGTFAPVNDIEVKDDTHPLTDGFREGEVFSLTASESKVPALVIDVEEWFNNHGTAQSTVVLMRGPESEEPEAASLIALEDSETNQRIVLGFFAFYRLPTDVQETLALNAVAWLLEQ